MHHREKPTRVWLLPVDAEPRRLTDEELDGLFVRYPDTGWEPRLEKLYTLLGCDIVEMRRIQKPVGTLWIDEEGLFKESPFVNPTATTLYQREYVLGAEGHPVVGTCFFVVHASCKDGADERALKEAFEIFKMVREIPMTVRGLR